MRFFLVLVAVLLVSCNPQKKDILAKEIIDKTIIYSGSNKISRSEISFIFRDKKYHANRHHGSFTLSRKFDSIEDVLTNSGFTRYINGQPVKLSDADALKYSNATNSVHYFSVLPHGLHDSAVQKKVLPNVIIKGKEYYKIQVSFEEDGGGQDYEDIFIYWIGKEDYLIDYLAYSYKTNGGGMRFRELKEQCVKRGIRFVDYYNYKPLQKSIQLTDIDKAYKNNQLEKVSEIILKDIEVKLIN